MLAIKCQHCSEPMEIPESRIGQIETCPACKKEITINPPREKPMVAAPSNLASGQPVLGTIEPPKYRMVDIVSAMLVLWSVIIALLGILMPVLAYMGSKIVGDSFSGKILFESLIFFGGSELFATLLLAASKALDCLKDIASNSWRK